jgi:hypothetical protein
MFPLPILFYFFSLFFVLLSLSFSRSPFFFRFFFFCYWVALAVFSYFTSQHSLGYGIYTQHFCFSFVFSLGPVCSFNDSYPRCFLGSFPKVPAHTLSPSLCQLWNLGTGNGVLEDVEGCSGLFITSMGLAVVDDLSNAETNLGVAAASSDDCELDGGWKGILRLILGGQTE